MSAGDQHVAEHPDADRVHRPARARLALPRRRPGRRAEPLPGRGPGRRRAAAAVRLGRRHRRRLRRVLRPTTGFVRLTDPARKAVVRPAGAFGPDDAGRDPRDSSRTATSIHQFREWLLGTVGSILDDDLSIGSAGLLKGGAVAWVSVEVPETITTPEGVEFRPNLLACTSHDGSLATTFQRVVTNVVCDNTMSAALAETGQRIKVRHSRHSRLRLGEARQALAHRPHHRRRLRRPGRPAHRHHRHRPAVGGVPRRPLHHRRRRAPAPARSPSSKRDTLTRLWDHDARVAPWRGTAWGVVQAVNTYTHHEQTVRGTDRAERNMLRAVDGGTDTLDPTTLTTLRGVLA